MFTVDEARATMRGLLDRTGLSGFPVYVTYYEIGLSMQLSNEASRYIGLVSGIVSGTENMFMEDAHFREMCQKTTRKTKNVRKVYKIYDKTFEALDRCRRHVPPNILRIETAYRKQKVPVGEFFGVFIWIRRPGPSSGIGAAFNSLKRLYPLAMSGPPNFKQNGRLL